MVYAIKRKKSFWSDFFIGKEYLAEFVFRDGVDYLFNPCGYFAQHVISPTITDTLKKLAEENDGIIVTVPDGFLKSTATYDLDDPACYKGRPT